MTHQNTEAYYEVDQTNGIEIITLEDDASKITNGGAGNIPEYFNLTDPGCPCSYGFYG